MVDVFLEGRDGRGEARLVVKSLEEADHARETDAVIESVVKAEGEKDSGLNRPGCEGCW